VNVGTESLAVSAGRSRVGDFVELTKPRITALVVLTSWVGYYLGARGDVLVSVLLHTLLGTALTCAGTSALNMILERDLDALMQRTRGRPLPAGRLGSGEALWFAMALALAGLFELALFVNMLASLIAAATLALYLFVYTPLKRRTWLSTMVGAVPGALPPMIGWAAATGGVSAGGWALFAIQFVWQLPHFYAIAWMFREDYARGGFPMLSVIDPDGALTGRQIAGWTAVLLPASLLPVFLEIAGLLYAGAALLLGLVLLILSLGVAARHDVPRARRVFLGSILYLPALFGCLVLDRLLA
jgi:protoheme IX farnesyltransferase